MKTGKNISARRNDFTEPCFSETSTGITKKRASARFYEMYHGSVKSDVPTCGQGIISAVVHMDEKTPHMHLCFVPLTEDKRLSAKEIVGNKKKLTWWQDEFWKHMVKKYPDLERGESVSETGRTHIPPRLFKEAVHLNRMKDQIMAILNDSNPFNKKAKAEELEALLDKYIPGVEIMRTKLKKYDKTYKELTEENAELEKKLSSASRESIQKKLETQRKLSELDELRRTVEVLPPEILQEAKKVIAHKPQER